MDPAGRECKRKIATLTSKTLVAFLVQAAKNAAQFIEDKTHEARFDELIWMLRQKRDEAIAPGVALGFKAAEHPPARSERRDTIDRSDERLN